MEIVIKVNSTYNNTIVSALYRGKILKTISTGSLGFKKAKRASTLAAQTCGEVLGAWLLQLNKNIMVAQKARKLGQLDTTVSERSKLQKGISVSIKQSSASVEGSFSKADPNDSSKGGQTPFEHSVNELEYSILSEAKKKLATTKLSTGNKKGIQHKGGQSLAAGSASLKEVSEASKQKLTASQVKGKKIESENQTPFEEGDFSITKGSLTGTQAKLEGTSRVGGLDPKSTNFVIKQVTLLIAGVGYGKFGVIRGLSKLGIKIKTISDVTAVPHNGCKPPKMRRK